MEARGAPRAGGREASGRSAAPGQRGLVRRDKSEGRYLVHAVGSTEERRWLNASIRPVLKHGPRSLTCMRAGGWQTHEAQVT